MALLSWHQSELSLAGVVCVFAWLFGVCLYIDLSPFFLFCLSWALSLGVYRLQPFLSGLVILP